MKTRYISIIAALLCAVSAMAQTHYESNISIGGKGGIAMSRVFFNPEVEQGMDLGATVGFQFRYIEESHFGLIAELDFVQRGWKENFEGAPYSYSRTANYLEIPVLAHIYFGRRGRFFVNLGPQVGVFLCEGTHANFDPKEIATLPDFPVSGRTTAQLTLPTTGKVDFGISGSVGGEFSITRRHAISLEARFYYGLGNMLKSGRTEQFRASNQMSVAVTLGYWFRLK